MMSRTQVWDSDLIPMMMPTCRVLVFTDDHTTYDDKQDVGCCVVVFENMSG